MQIVEQQYERTVRGEHLQHAADGPMGPIARISMPRRGAGLGRPGRQHLGKVGADVVAHPVQAVRAGCPQIFVERVDEQPERQVLLELRGACGQHQHAARVGTRTQLGQQPALADAGLAGQQHDRRPSRGEPAQHLAERVQLGDPADRAATMIRHRQAHLPQQHAARRLSKPGCD
jgi:hypothetical protein